MKCIVYPEEGPDQSQQVELYLRSLSHVSRWLGRKLLLSSSSEMSHEEAKILCEFDTMFTMSWKSYFRKNLARILDFWLFLFPSPWILLFACSMV